MELTNSCEPGDNRADHSTNGVGASIRSAPPNSDRPSHEAGGHVDEAGSISDFFIQSTRSSPDSVCSDSQYIDVQPTCRYSQPTIAMQPAMTAAHQ